MTRLVLILAVLASTQLSAATLKTEPVIEPRQIGDELMKYVAADDMIGLFAQIAKHMPMDRAEIEKMRDSSIEQRKQLPPVLGKSRGFAFIKECRASDLLVRVVYVEKREKSVVRWQFIFYRSRDSWTMVNFLWNQDLNSLFEPCG